MKLNYAIGLTLATGAWCIYESYRAEAHRSNYRTAYALVVDMAADADRIAQLRRSPTLATERERPNDQLLDQIRQALTGAQVPEGQWIGNEPLAPVRVPKSPYKRLGTRLTFSALELRRLAGFVLQLVGADSTLDVSSLRLQTPPGSSPTGWNVELLVSYLIYSPVADAPTIRSPSTGGR